MSQKNKIDVDKIDLDKMAEKVTDNPGLLPYSHSVGGIVIKPEDKGKIKGRALSAMRQQTDKQLQQLYSQMETLVNQAKDLKSRVDVSEMIYMAQISFEPLIGHSYYLYEKKENSDTYVLSMVHPDEWGRSKPFERYIARVTLLADHTWEVEEHKEE